MKEGSWKAPQKIGKVNINSNQLAIFALNNNHSGIHDVIVHNNLILYEIYRWTNID